MSWDREIAGALTMLLTVCMSGLADSASWFSPRRCKDVASIAPGRRRKMPDDFFTPEAVAEMRRRAEEDAEEKARVAAVVAQAERLARLSDQDYREMIIPYSGYPLHGYTMVCPFCGRKCTAHDSALPNEYDFHKPYQTRRRCCGTVVYEREEDYPPDYAYRPNGVVQVPHFDGAERPYPCWRGKNTHGEPTIFFPRSLVWQDRMDALRDKVCSTLAEAYLYTGDEEYARKTLVILHRFAEIYRDLPLWTRLDVSREEWEFKQPTIAKGRSGGLAPSPSDPTRPLTREEYEAWPRPARYARAPWVTGPSAEMGPTRFGMMAGIYWGGLEDMSLAYLMVKNSRGMAELSTELWDAPDKLDAFIREGLLEELAKECTAYPPLMGNYISLTMIGCYYLGLAARSDYLYNLALDFADLTLLTHVYPDIAFEQGSLLYIGMMGGYHNNVKKMMGRQIATRDAEFPFSKYARENFWRVFANMSTFRYVQSKHGDGEDSPFPIGWHPGSGTGQPPPCNRMCGPTPCDPEDERRCASRFMPGYGFATLTSGAPGARTESLILFNRSWAHNHSVTLSLQLAFEGFMVAPEIGYCAWWRTLDVTPKNPKYDQLMALPYKYKLLDADAPAPGLDARRDVWSRWDSGVNNLSHCGVLQNHVLVNERAPARVGQGRRGGGRALTLSAPRSAGTVGATLQVVEVEDPESFRIAGVNCELYRRSVLNIERPDGRAYVVDLFRVTGGERHLYQLKLPGADLAANTLADPVRAGNGQDYLDTKPGVAESRSRAHGSIEDQADGGFQFLNRLLIFRDLPEDYRIAWRRDLKRFAPKSPETLAGKPVFASWIENAPTVVVDMRVVNLPLPPFDSGQHAADEEVWFSNAHYPCRLEETVDGAPQTGITAFENALTVYSRFRSGRTSLESRFAHVFEMYPQGQQSVIKQIAPLFPAPKQLESSYVAGLNILFRDGGRDLVASMPDCKWRDLAGSGAGLPGEGSGIAARFALLRLAPDGGFLCGEVVNGKGFVCGDVGVQSAGDLTGELADIVGDITGTRKESALIIRPHGPWPAGDALVGERIHVAAAPDEDDVYTVARVQRIADDRVRVDLEGTPPLAYHWDQVKQVAADDPSSFEISFDSLHKGLGNRLFINKRILFPTLELELRVADVPYMSNRTWLSVKPEVDLARLGVKPGTPFLIYGMAVGNLVRVPSRIAVRKSAPGRFTVQTNVDFTLRDGGRERRLNAEELRGRETEIEL